MPITSVVNLTTDSYDVYIGRRSDTEEHFGNPYSHLELSNTIKVNSRKESIENYRKWLIGIIDTDKEQVRRQWILNNLDLLDSKILGCFCKPKKCHGDILIEIIENKNLSDIF